jgi:hypothetical protein
LSNKVGGEGMLRDDGGAAKRLARAAHEIVVASAEAGIQAAIRELLSIADDEDGQPDPAVLYQDPQHVGTPARRIDALAQEAAKRGATDKWHELEPTLVDRVENIAYVGEESGSHTQMIRPRTLVVRLDPLDGTTSAVNIVNAFSSVATADFITDPAAPARHLAGAIIGGEVDVSWMHWSRRGHLKSSYLRPLGQVLIRSVRVSTGWRQLEVAQDEREALSVASVAASRKRFMAFAPFRDAIFAKEGTVYHLAGNPLCTALLLGRVGAFVETQHVTLHDSVFLIPHWLLGGHIETLDGSRFDYLSQYETNAQNFDPGAKLIPPYIAYVGENNPLSDTLDDSTRSAAVIDLRTGESGRSPARPRLFRQD